MNRVRTSTQQWEWTGTQQWERTGTQEWERPRFDLLFAKCELPLPPFPPSLTRLSMSIGPTTGINDFELICRLNDGCHVDLVLYLMLRFCFLGCLVSWLMVHLLFAHCLEYLLICAFVHEHASLCKFRLQLAAADGLGHTGYRLVEFLWILNLC